MMAFFVYPGLYKQFVDRLPDSYWVLPFATAAFILTLWGFIEIGLLRGTLRDNRFGPDPFAEAEAADKARSSKGSSRFWDQQGALEMVPHSASPPDGMHVKPGA
jgi:hypothetical protein